MAIMLSIPELSDERLEQMTNEQLIMLALSFLLGLSKMGDTVLTRVLLRRGLR